MFPRDWFHFEAPEDGGGGSPDPAPEPSPEPTPEPAPEPTPEASWALSQDDWEQTQQALYYLAQQQQAAHAQAAQRMQPERQGFQMPAAPDPWADDYAEQVAARDAALFQQFGQMMQQSLGQYVGPIQSWARDQQLAEGEARAEDIYDDLISREGELPGSSEQAFEVAHALANALLSQTSERYGYGPRAAEVALEQSVSTIRSLLEEAGQAAVEKYKNQISGLAGAPSEPGAAGAGSQVLGGDYESLKDVARKYFNSAVA